MTILEEKWAKSGSKPIVKITPVGMIDLDHVFTVYSDKADQGKIYGYDTRTEATRERAKMVKLFKENNYVVRQ